MKKSAALPRGWKWAKIGEICDLAFGERITRKQHAGEKYPVYGGGNATFLTDKYNRKNEYVFSRFALSRECVRFVSGKFWLIDSGGTFSIKKEKQADALKNFVGYYFFNIQRDIFALARGQGQQNLDVPKFREIKIPLPPLAEQKRIAEKLGKQIAAVEKARQAAEKKLSETRRLSAALLRAAFIPAKNWERVKLENGIEHVKYTSKIPQSKYAPKGKFPIIDQSVKFIAGYWDNPKDVFRVTKPIIAFGDHTKCFKYIDFDFVLGADGIKLLLPIDKFNSKFFYYACRNAEIKNLGYSRHYKELKETYVFCPPLSGQRQIVQKLDGQLSAAARAEKSAKAELQEIRALPAALLRRAFGAAE